MILIRPLGKKKRHCINQPTKESMRRGIQITKTTNTGGPRRTFFKQHSKCCKAGKQCHSRYVANKTMIESCYFYFLVRSDAIRCASDFTYKDVARCDRCARGQGWQGAIAIGAGELVGIGATGSLHSWWRNWDLRHWSHGYWGNRSF